MKKLSAGFTLIELLVVISILGLLAALLISNISGVRERARDVQRKSDLDQIKKALRMYYNDHNSYPSSVPFGAVFNDPDGTMVYMKEVPNDPSTGATYSYYSHDAIAHPCTEGTNDFRLVAVLENKSDASITKSHSRCADGCGFTWDDTDQDEYVVCAD